MSGRKEVFYRGQKPLESRKRKNKTENNFRLRERRNYIETTQEFFFSLFLSLPLKSHLEHPEMSEISSNLSTFQLSSLVRSPRALDFYSIDEAGGLVGLGDVAKSLRAARENLHKRLFLPGGYLLRLHHGPVSCRHECGRRMILMEGNFFFRIDICQFSITSLMNSSEDKSRSISFRSIILIMIYAGTIILNLLAASVDNKFPLMQAQPPDNSTEVPESAETDNSVSLEMSKRSPVLMGKFQTLLG